MANLKATPTTFEEASAFLGARTGKTLGHNTTIGLDPWDHDAIVVRLHGNVIVSYFEDGTTQYNSAGWRTVTTKDRINQLLPGGYKVSQVDFQWVLWRIGRLGDVPWSDPMTFRGGVRVA